MKARKRVFGGAAGLWMRRKKRIQGPGSSQESQLSSSSQELSVAKEKPVQKKRPSLDWDELRCRPVYEASTTDCSSSSSDFESDNASDVLEDGLQGAATFESPINDEEDSDADEDGVGGSADDGDSRHGSWLEEKPFGNRKKRTFGTKKVTPFFSPENPGDALHVSKSNKRRRVVSHGKDTPKTSSVDSNKPARAPSVQIKRTVAHPKTELASQDSSNLDFDCAKHEITIMATPKEVHQPSSTTSLTVARTFFQQLDDHHQLKLDSTASPDGKNRVSGRSRRVLTQNHPALNKEYKQYTAACKESHVEPLPFESFLEQRCLFHDSLYDGFLDD